MIQEKTVLARVYGIVQGVGFRPTVDRHAQACGVRGSVCNKGPYVEIKVQGEPESVDRFLHKVEFEPPERSSILKMDVYPAEDKNLQFTSFEIIESEKIKGDIFVSPDIAICEKCKKEMYDPQDKRYLHPFINCTCCGPRLTILDSMPYDRVRTSMGEFPMCPTCEYEYTHAETRRYDAQPVCCNDCGPQVYLLPGDGESKAPVIKKKGLVQAIEQMINVAGEDLPVLSEKMGCRMEQVRSCSENSADCAGINENNSRREKALFENAGIRGGKSDFEIYYRNSVKISADKNVLQNLVHDRAAITATRKIILEGGIVAIKGIGGFHLCCDATNQAAVERLRKLKTRPAKPFAVMMRDMETVERECFVEPEQLEVLNGHQKPIILLKRKKAGTICQAVAPDNPKVGVMLPYAPVQLLLFRYDDGLEMPDCLVMTSGNRSGAPICRDDVDAVKELSAMCDAILSHNRLIRLRADDSVMDFYRGKPYMIRRSRGYAPLPFMMTNGWSGEVLAVGGELKNTFCIGKNDLFYQSPYIGDMGDLRTVKALRESITRMEGLLEAEPSIVACDLHPKYNTTYVAQDLGLPVIQVQHHYAHILSCMAENDYAKPVIGISFDGTGYGTDGTIWGGEVLLADYDGFERLGHIRPFLQVGGDASAKEGWRIAVSMIYSLLKNREKAMEWIQKLQLCDEKTAKVQFTMADKKLNSVISTSAGRLFDAVSAILQIRKASTFEGEASTTLEFAAEAYEEACLEARMLPLADMPECLKQERKNLVEVEKTDENSNNIPAPVENKSKQTEEIESKNDAAFAGNNCKSIEEIEKPETVTVSKIIESRKLPKYQLKTENLVRILTESYLAGTDAGLLAYWFHDQLAEMVSTVCQMISEATGITTTALSGGVYQNQLLVRLTSEKLEKAGLQVLRHSLLPPNDGGIALGQAVAAMRQLNR